MKGLSLACVAACLFLPYSAAQASTPAPWVHEAPHAKAPRGEEIRFVTPRPHKAGDEISFGADVISGAPPAGQDAPAAGGPEVVVAPIYVPVAAEPADTPSRGPRIIYIGPETARKTSGPIPQIIYGDIPARSAGGPEVLYGDGPR